MVITATHNIQPIILKIKIVLKDSEIPSSSDVKTQFSLFSVSS